MKNILTLSFIIALFSSCSGLVDGLNNNPNSPTSAPYHNILTGAEVANIVLYSGEFSRKTGIFSGQYTGLDRNHLGYWRYAVTTNSFNQEWNNVYADLLINARATEDAAVAEGIEGVTIGVCQTLQALALGAGTAVWGDIPFDEGGIPDIISPVFEGQIVVYEKLQALLDEAISNFASGTGRPFSNSEIFFDGEPGLWTKAAYTLKARYYMHTKEYNKAYEAAQSGISSKDGNLMGPHGTAVENSNLNYQFFAVAVRQSDLVTSDFMTSLVAPDIAINPDFSNYRGNVKTNETGRYNYLFHVTSFGTQPNTNDGFAAQNAPSPIVTYEENTLILAEAGIRSAGFDAGLNHLNEYRAFLQSGGYMTNATAQDLKYEAYESADFEKGGMENMDGLNASDALLREILEERYISLFGQLEVFNDVRRTEGESEVRVPIKPNEGNQLPQRFLYPSTEIERNVNTPNPVLGLFERTAVNAQ